MINSLFLFVLFFPLFAGFIMGLFGNKIGLNKIIILYYTMYSFSAVYLVYQFMIFLKCNATIKVKLFDIVCFENFVINFTFLFDMFTLVMMFVVVFISFLVSIFSVWYIKGDPNHLKFLNFLNFFTFFMLLLVSSDNIVIIFIGWEGIGIFSYFLINFWSTRLNANRSSFKAVLVNKIGDCFFYLFIFIYFFIFESFSINECKYLLLSNFSDNFLEKDFKLYAFLAVLLIFAAMAKSAQIIFHVWLPDAMEGPTPVSALLHAATMVTAGAYVLTKLSWIFLNNKNLFFFVALVGVLTNLLSSLIAIFQHDIKKIIAYSTASQIGIIFISIGVVKPNLALFHIFNHAFFKALLFILAGIIIHYMNNNQDIRFLFKIKNNLFFVYSTLIIASMTLAGLPFLSSYFSKEFIIQNSFLNQYWVENIIFYFLNLSIITTVLYTFKILFFIFFADNNKTFLNEDIWVFYKKNKFYKFKEENDLLFYFNSYKTITFVLAFMSIFTGFLFFIPFNYDFFFFTNNFFDNLDLEKSVNISFFEYSFLMIVMSLLFSLIIFYYIFSCEKKFFINFSKNYQFLLKNFEIKFFIESFLFYLSELFFSNRTFLRVLDKEVTENFFSSYFKEKKRKVVFFIQNIFSHPFFIFLAFFWISLDLIVFYTFPFLIVVFFAWLLEWLIWDFINNFLSKYFK